MGDSFDEGALDEKPVHNVAVSAFYMDKYEVTKALWDEVYSWATVNGYSFDNAGYGMGSNHPVQSASWYDTIKWINARSEKEGRTPVYYEDPTQATIYRTGQVNVTNDSVKWDANGYRLPTEAEWEYAVRSGTTTRFYTGDCISTDQANYNGTNLWGDCPGGVYRQTTTAVGSFAPNPWGLYDMAGNVWEWTWDLYGAYSSESATNPKGPDSGSYRVIRGGGWFNFGADRLRSAIRFGPSLAYTATDLGFRCALSLTNTQEGSIYGTVTYTAKQTGTLKVSAFSNLGMSERVGQTFSVPWSNSSMAYSLNSLPPGTYYVSAFIDSDTANDVPTLMEAQGAYPSAISITSGNVVSKDFTLYDPYTDDLPSYWVDQYSTFNNGSGIAGAGDDADHDGYTNLVEYQNSTDPTIQSTPNGAGYDASTDTRSYTVSGTITYNGIQTGTLKVGAFAPSDIHFVSPIGTIDSKPWSGSSQSYMISAPSGTYVIAAYIDKAGGGTWQSSAASGVLSGTVSIAGINLTDKDFTLTDSKNQILISNPINPTGRPAGNFYMDFSYNTTDGDNSLTGLGLRLYYDSSKLTFAGFSDVFGTPLAIDTDPQNDAENGDGDATTDKYLGIAWTDFGGNWPGSPLPAKLFRATFSIAAGLAQGVTTTIKFSRTSGASGYGFSSDPVTLTVQPFNLDVDGNGVADALTDGLLIIRKLFGFSGDSLIKDAIDSGAVRNTALDIENYIADDTMLLDIDGNGTTDALTDGLLIIRKLFGFTGNSLIKDAVDVGAVRSTAPDIEAYIQGLMP